VKVKGNGKRKDKTFGRAACPDAASWMARDASTWSEAGYGESGLPRRKQRFI
jgi:hypothetical protein